MIKYEDWTKIGAKASNLNDLQKAWRRYKLQKYEKLKGRAKKMFKMYCLNKCCFF